MGEIPYLGKQKSLDRLSFHIQHNNIRTGRPALIAQAAVRVCGYLYLWPNPPNHPARFRVRREKPLVGNITDTVLATIRGAVNIRLGNERNDGPVNQVPFSFIGTTGLIFSTLSTLLSGPALKLALFSNGTLMRSETGFCVFLARSVAVSATAVAGAVEATTAANSSYK